ncbi:MAG: L-idonate 5-dehydrogenase [Deltaproteobacteria bacterium]|nr:L-idonate 5-dehydrogenase [Deltaproteobacteria bacterium]MBT7204271.1 L-idonate 5-dehydrogenase [Deltaproteobacteria bacterium]
MLQCSIHGAEDLRIEDVPCPQPGPDQALVKMGAAGICGSDMHYFRHGQIGKFKIQEPLIPGHEASGVIAGLGTNVTGLEEGQRVAINPSHPCGKCSRCREGCENLCDSMFFLGSASVFPHAQGMFREYFLISAKQCIPVSNQVSLQELALSEPLSVGLHAVNRAGNLFGKRVLISGSGTIGCMVLLAAKLDGAEQVTMVDVLEEPLAIARKVGADLTICVKPSASPSTELLNEFDVAFEVSGAASALGNCIELVRRGGTIVQVGTLPAEGIHLFANQIMVKELDIRGSMRFGNVFSRAVRLLENQRLNVQSILTGRFPIAEAAKALQLAFDKTVSMKVQIVTD